MPRGDWFFFSLPFLVLSSLFCVRCCIVSDTRGFPGRPGGPFPYARATELYDWPILEHLLFWQALGTTSDFFLMKDAFCLFKIILLFQLWLFVASFEIFFHPGDSHNLVKFLVESIRFRIFIISQIQPFIFI